MKITISHNNPFGYNRYGFLWEVLKEHGKGIHLDYGAYNGKIIKCLSETDVIEQAVGVDVNAKVVNDNINSMPRNVILKKIIKGEKLPYDNSYFDSVSILDVIEHIHDQKMILKELHRILKPGGILIITVPKKHIFSFLDMGNFKFLFPRIHKYFYINKYSEVEYKKRYIDCENGLFGDIEKEKMWHQHFAPQEMEALLNECGFRVRKFDGSGLFMRPLNLLSYFSPGLIKRAFSILRKVDARVFMSTNLFCVAQKSIYD